MKPFSLEFKGEEVAKHHFNLLNICGSGQRLLICCQKNIEPINEGMFDCEIDEMSRSFKVP